MRIFSTAAPQAVWVHDPSTLRFLLVNDATLQLYGWQRGEFLAMTVCALAPAGEAAILPPASHQTTGSSIRVAPFEARHVTRDGRVVEVDVWMRSIVLGGRAAALVFALDVSERRASGRALIDGLAAEQQRIAGEIHDGLGQELTGLSLSLRALATRAQRSSQPLATELDELAKLGHPLHPKFAAHGPGAVAAERCRRQPREGAAGPRAPRFD